jgi:hypothetical protein
LSNVRALMLAIFAAEFFVLMVPPLAGAGGLLSVRGMPAPDALEAARIRRRAAAARRTALDPAAIGPAAALVLLTLTFLWS